MWHIQDSNRSHGSVPKKIVKIAAAINRGRIPDEFENVIPSSFETEEDYTMEAGVSPTYVGKRSNPAWCVELVLNDGMTISSQCIIFDLNGDFYE